MGIAMGKYLGYRRGRNEHLKTPNILSDPNFINYMHIAWGGEGTKCKL